MPSLHNMYWNAYFNRKQVRTVLDGADKLHLFPSEEDLETIKSVFEALSIVEAGTRDLCGQKETLASADLGSDTKMKCWNMSGIFHGEALLKSAFFRFTFERHF